MPVQPLCLDIRTVLWEKMSLCTTKNLFHFILISAHGRVPCYYNCSSKYYKCPDYYCIPWRYLCDAEWNCPRGNDEINCVNRTCPGQLKCKNSEICIAIDNVCDGFSDCPYFDDTNFCESILATCPVNCTCLLYSISCININLLQTSMKQIISYVSIVLINVDIPRLVHALKKAERLVFLIVKFTNLELPCPSSRHYKESLTLHSLDISQNIIKKLTNHCFRSMHQLRFLYIKQNMLKKLARFAFGKMLRVLDLSQNFITVLMKSTFGDFSKTTFA